MMSRTSTFDDATGSDENNTSKAVKMVDDDMSVKGHWDVVINDSDTADSNVAGYATHPQYYNPNHGFILGWFVLMTTIVIVIVCLYDAYSGSDYTYMVITLSYSTNIAISALCIVVIPLTMYRMSVLTFKDEEIKKMRGKQKENEKHLHITRAMDKSLLRYTLIAMAILKIMIMIAGYTQDNYLLFADGLVSIISAYLQTTFINFYASQKRTTTEQHRRNKPGRQELEFLRLCNLSLWLVNTFVLKHHVAKKIPEEAFGIIAWVIISNIAQPLTILFYFHSITCLAEVIVHSYSTKYIGLIRPHKAISRITMNTYYSENL